MSDMKDLDMDSLKAKIDAMKLEKQGDLCPLQASRLLMLHP